jgi:hypothetical protein
MKEGVMRDLERQKLKREEHQIFENENLQPETAKQTNQNNI